MMVKNTLPNSLKTASWPDSQLSREQTKFTQKESVFHIQKFTMSEKAVKDLREFFKNFQINSFLKS